MEYVNNLQMEEQEEQDYAIAKSWALDGENGSIAITIKQKMARRYGWKRPCTLLLIPQKDGILLKELKIT